MSAIIGISDLETVHLLTDGATTYLADGVVAVIHSKQVVTRCRAAVAAMGLWSPVLRFTRLADERANTFDELVAVAPELWDRARAPLPDSARAIPHAALLAGWSAERARVELHVLGDEPSFSRDVLVYAAGPAPTGSCQGFCDEFVARFAADPRQFDPVRDGISFMQTLRRHHPRKFELTERAVVGGYITCTAVTRDGIETSRIHEWPDHVGRPIDGTKVGLSMWAEAFASEANRKQQIRRPTTAHP